MAHRATCTAPLGIVDGGVEEHQDIFLRTPRGLYQDRGDVTAV